MRHPGVQLVGVIEPGTENRGPVERVLREYELTGGLVDATDVNTLKTLDVILFGINWRLAPGVASAVHAAVTSGVGLFNEWWTDSQSTHPSREACQLMLAEPPV